LICLFTAVHVARFVHFQRARIYSATGSPYFWLKPCFSDIPGKMTLILVFWQPFWDPDGVK
jgi:hypothetical protein